MIAGIDINELLRTINSVLLAFSICIFIAFVVNSMIKRINVFGNPLNKLVFLHGKIGNFGCWSLFAYKTVEGYPSPAAYRCIAFIAFIVQIENC